MVTTTTCAKKSSCYWPPSSARTASSGTQAALTTIDGIGISFEGSRLGPYQLGPRVGAGGMGEVYKATDTRLDRTVAIKVLPAHVATAPQARERFEREALAQWQP